MALFEVDDSNFDEEVLLSEEDVLVDFYATWCMPCKMLSPVVDKVAENMKVCKVNIDDAKKSVLDYMIVSVPTLIAFRNGEEINRLSGVTDEEGIINLFK
ncbi:MAG: thioredoxin [Eubacterium sp.]